MSPGCVPRGGAEDAGGRRGRQGAARVAAGDGGDGAAGGGAPEGLAAVLVGQKRIVLLDLEEDECDEDE